jgi:hypothetical protein
MDARSLEVASLHALALVCFNPPCMDVFISLSTYVNILNLLLRACDGLIKVINYITIMNIDLENCHGNK